MKIGDDIDEEKNDEVDNDNDGDVDDDDDEKLHNDQQVARSKQHGGGRQYDQLARLTDFV